MKILKAIGAAVLAVATCFSARAEESTTETLVKEPLILDGVEAGYTVTGLPNNEVAVVFTNHVDGAVTWTAPADLENVQFLVVGGGGGGGSKTAGGGGGGGGVITGSVFSISSSAAIEVQVGGGGKGGEGDGKTGAKGSDSKFKVGGVTYVTAYGGGYGAPRNKTGSSGGSGGGGEKGGGAATQGSADSNYVSYVKHGYEGYDGGWNAGGGGGGATAAGSSLTGGLGLSSFITGEECVYGSGGDGKKASGTGSSGAANSGDGGGGGGAGNGGSGGSGIVVLRYTLPTGGLVAAPESIDPKSYTGTALTPNVPELLGYTVIVNNNVDCIDAGNYNVVLKLNEGFTWKDAEGDAASADKTLTFTIAQAENAWETEPSITPAFWEEEATPGAFVNGKPKFGEVVVAYMQNGNTLNELPTTRGNYEAVFTVTGNNNYTGLSKTIAFEILAVVNHWTVEPSISLTSWMEGAIPGTVTPGATRFGSPAATISKDGGEATTFSGTMPTEPGSYVITYTAPAATEEYSAPEVTEKTISFTIIEFNENPEVTTTAMANPSWGYVVDYLGDNHNETVVVFTNHTAAMTWTAPYDVKNVEFLVVGGGGGGGADNKDNDNRQGGAGGGGGGVVTGFVDFEYGQTVAVTVGAGGEGGTAGESYSSGFGASRSGKDSSFGVGDVAWVTAYGGGRDRGAKTEEGFTDGYAGGEGGSGAGGRPGMSGGAATQGEAVLDYVTSAEKHGYAGGDGCPTPYSEYGNAAAGGGGGAGGEGRPGYYVEDSNSHVGGEGGAGLVSSITGTQVSYGAGGGGGSIHGYGSIGGVGAGNGGNYQNDENYTGGDALVNQGGGGGGAGNQADGGNGGSGIVVFRYCTAKAEAKVDGNVYATLEEAVTAAQAGSTVTVLADAEIDATVVIEKSITLDMGGNAVTAEFDYSATKPAAFWVKNGGNLTLKNGTLSTTVEGIRLGVKQATDAATKGTATIESDVVITTSDIGVMLYGGSTLNSSGTITSSSTGFAAIQGNGLDTLASTITITGGSVSSTSNHAIYHPQPGTLTVSGGEISGVTGIEMRAGTLNMEDGTVAATGTYAKPGANNSGSTVNGAAIVLSQHSTGKNVTATITGGAITAGDNGKTFVVANTTGADPVSVTAEIAAAVTFDASKAVVLIDTLKLDGNETDGYTLVEKVYVASVTDANNNVTKYEVFAGALAAAESGSTVKLLANTVYGEILTLADGVTLDLNGKSFQTLAVFGDLAMNGGSLKTYDTTTQTYYFMAAPAETAGALFWTSDAVLNVSSENYGLVLKSGAITMPNTWRSLVGQSLAINAGASFTIPENVTWNLRGNAVVNEGATLVCNGTISLGESIDTIDATATLTTTDDTLNVVSACEGYEVQYANGAYTLVKAAIDITIGETTYESVDALVAAANSGTAMTVPVSETVTWSAEGNVLKKNGETYATFATYYDVKVDGTSVTLSLGNEVTPVIAESEAGAGDAFVMTAETVTIKIRNAVKGLYYGIQQYSDAACATKVGEAELTAAGADGAVALSIDRSDADAAFFRVVVTDIKPVDADGGTVEESTDPEEE